MIRHFFLAIIANALVLWSLTQFLPNYITIGGGVITFIIAGLFLGLLNTLIKPLIKLVALPLMIITIGLFSIVINIIILVILEFTTNLLAIGDMSLEVSGGIIGYLTTSILLAIMNVLAHWLIKK